MACRHRMHDGLMEAACNPDKAPGAGNDEFRQVTSELAPAGPPIGESMTGADEGWGPQGHDGGWAE
ncbi:hypothetical protein [Aurantiacibacter hainanensis]|uniref:hypothetical protein n=1 Tax=Aurantiacibacter hainanensis TaxID=3076114 RepID=UPI0030C6BD24